MVEALAFDLTYETTIISKSSTPPVVYSNYTSTLPVIDGLLSQNEWRSPAITKTLNYTNCITGQNETHEMFVYFMNDDTYLYIAIKITNEDFESEDVQEGDVDVIEIYFDNNDNEVIEPNEDIKNFWNFEYGDWFYEGNGSWCDDVGYGGTLDGRGIATHSTHSVGDSVYEFENYLGNYWDDYTEPDDNNDGIGDTPYPIDGDKDNYPLMQRFENYIGIPKLNVSIIAPPEGFSIITGSELIVKAKVLDEDKLLYNATVEGKLSSISFDLYDDGKSTHGDDVEDDGIYSAIITVPKVQNAVLEINAIYEDKFGSASRNINIDTSLKHPLKVEAEIIDDNPPTFTGDTVKVRAVVSLNDSIVFSASAPFCIPAEINGNSIEIKEEDYELKKAVEKFASDNTEILNATKYDAHNLSIAGDYFFFRVDEDATEGIASITAALLAYLTTDALFPSIDYKTWYGELLDKSFKELSNSVLEKLFHEYLLKYKQEPEFSSPFSSSDLPNYLKLLALFRDNITETKQDTLSNFAPIPEDQKTFYRDNLNERNKANNRVKDLISKEVEFPYDVYKARLAEDTDWKKDFIKGIGAAITGFLCPPAGLVGKALLDTYNTVNNLDEDGRLVTIASETFSDMYVKSKKIKDNTVSGISQFKDASPSIIPEIDVLTSQDFSKEGLVQVSGAGNIWFKTEKECYTLIEVKNTGTTPADVWVVAYFPNVIDGGRESLDPGEYRIFRIDYVNPYFKSGYQP